MAQNETHIMAQSRRLAALQETNIRLMKQGSEFEKVYAKNAILKQTIGVKEQEALKHLHSNVATTKALKSAQREIQDLEEKLQNKNNHIKRLENQSQKNPNNDSKVVEEQRGAIKSLQRMLTIKNNEVKDLDTKLTQAKQKSPSPDLRS